MSDTVKLRSNPQAALIARHWRFGWWALLVFVLVGGSLELLHAFKVDAYLNADQETRRLMWRLGHAHGGLFALLNILFAARPSLDRSTLPKKLQFASKCLLLASVLIPSGFLLGGAVTYDGDPGLGVMLVPLGAALMACAVFLIALGGKQRTQPEERSSRQSVVPDTES
jgi:hypothetical protein